MSNFEEVGVIARFRGQTEFVRGAETSTAALGEMAGAANEVALAEGRVARRGFLMNQALFTMRRLMYGVSLAGVAVGVGAIKMGFNFNSAMQQAKVALQPVSAGVGGVHKRLISLFNFTKYTPFQFKDVTIAFRQMYLGMRTVGISADTVQTTLHSVTDALAATGKTSPGALNRVAVALQHMAYQGHLTGYSVNQLARDGIPIFAALRHELGLTGEQMHTIGSLGVPTQVALQAINKYIETTPGLMNAAYRQATHTLHGQFTTFKDNISQLMGIMETGVFGHFMNRLTRMNNFFNSIARQMSHHVAFSTIIGRAFGGPAEFAWKQFAADLRLAWKIFSGFISDLAHSHATWALLLSTLVLIHAILLPINFAVQHLGFSLNILIPVILMGIVAWKTYVALTRLSVFWTALEANKLGRLSMAQVLYNKLLRAQAVEGSAWLGIRSALNVLFTGTAMGKEYRALTLLERGALALRKQLITLFAPLVAVVTESWAFTASLLANPITWIVIGILALTAGLVVLYLKWKPFRTLVNETFGWLWRHPLAAMFIPVVGQLIIMAKLFLSIYRHIKQIYNLVRHPLGSFGGHGGFWGGVEHMGLGLLKSQVPFLAGGGTVSTPGTVVVGDRGPELMSLPRGATVTPLSAVGALGGGAYADDRKRTLQINFVVGQRVLERAIVDIIGDRLATT